MIKKFTLILAFVLPAVMLSSQPEEDQLGAWYMYFWNTTIGESSWGFQGDLQHRNWDLFGDLEQLLLRGGVTYQPKNTTNCDSKQERLVGWMVELLMAPIKKMVSNCCVMFCPIKLAMDFF